ncbi:MAG: LysR family transcriptional regulator [Firmicutes bacterium]|nr:LysR family transcriptional regulator [Bacillota bacterium]
MTLKQLQYFIALSKTCHFTSTADQLYISQSSLSYAISTLENELDVKLFDRNGGTITLSKYGKAYAASVETILKELEDANTNVRSLYQADLGKVNVGLFPSLYKEFMYAAITSFLRDMPGSMIEINYEGHKQAELFSLLEEEKIDLMFCVNGNENTETARVFDQELKLIVPENHRLAGRKSVDIDELSGEHFVMPGSGYIFSEQVKDVFARHRIPLNVISEQRTLTGVKSHVANGNGIAILPENASVYMYNLKTLSIDGDEFLRPVYLAWQADRKLPKAVVTVRDYLIANAETIFRNSLLLSQNPKVD